MRGLVTTEQKSLRFKKGGSVKKANERWKEAVYGLPKSEDDCHPEVRSIAPEDVLLPFSVLAAGVAAAAAAVAVEVAARKAAVSSEAAARKKKKEKQRTNGTGNLPPVYYN